MGIFSSTINEFKLTCTAKINIPSELIPIILLDGKFTIAIAFIYINILKSVQLKIDSNFPLAEWKILDTVHKLFNLTRSNFLYSVSSQYVETIYINFHITK